MIKSSLLIIAAFLLSSTQAISQRLSAYDPASDDVEIIVVRNDEGCSSESFIYKNEDEQVKKVAFLYPDQPEANNKASHYNSSMIREILTEYSLNGYSITDSKAENFDAVCDKKITYQLSRTKTNTRLASMTED